MCKLCASHFGPFSLARPTDFDRKRVLVFAEGVVVYKRFNASTTVSKDALDEDDVKLRVFIRKCRVDDIQCVSFLYTVQVISLVCFVEGVVIKIMSNCIFKCQFAW